LRVSNRPCEGEEGGEGGTTTVRGRARVGERVCDIRSALVMRYLWDGREGGRVGKEEEVSHGAYKTVEGREGFLKEIG